MCPGHCTLQCERPAYEAVTNEAMVTVAAAEVKFLLVLCIHHRSASASFQACSRRDPDRWGSRVHKDQAPTNVLLKECRKLVRVEERKELCEEREAPSGHGTAVPPMSIPKVRLTA